MALKTCESKILVSKFPLAFPTIIFMSDEEKSKVIEKCYSKTLIRQDRPDQQYRGNKDKFWQTNEFLQQSSSIFACIGTRQYLDMTIMFSFICVYQVDSMSVIGDGVCIRG